MKIQKITNVWFWGFAVAAAVIVASMIARRRGREKQLPKPQTNSVQELVLHMPNQTFIVLGNAAVIQAVEGYWDVLTNAFPTNIVTRDITLWRDKK